MSRFNKTQPAARVNMPLAPNKQSTILTGNSAPGFERDAKGELFTLAVANFVGQETFYENAAKRDTRYVQLIHAVAKTDPAWMAGFLGWLRTDGNMRTASIVGALEAAKAMVAAKIPGSRALVSSVLQRADEPGEALGYWLSIYGRQIPKPVKRGIADAVQRLYTERNALKYDTASHALRFGDVLELCHAAPGMQQRNQGELFKFLIDRRHDRGVANPNLPMIQANMALRFRSTEHPEALLNSAALRLAGMTWEDVLSLAGTKLDKKAVWQAMIPGMGYMALLRNLRNFEQAGIKGDDAHAVGAKLRDPSEVASSRQLPMRFLSAHRACTTHMFSQAIEEALEHSLANIPEFPGRTLILVDTSGSMNEGFSKDGTLKRWDAAAMFGLAMAKRCQDADVYSFSNSTKQFPMSKNMSLLRALETWKSAGYFFGGGTATGAAIKAHYKSHDRLVILTDEQANAHGGWGSFQPTDILAPVPKDKMVVTFNLAGYQAAHAAGSPTRITVAGLNDKAFSLIHMLEGRAAGKWPWEA